MALEDCRDATALFSTLFSLEGQVAVVTGAAAGLGKEIAWMLGTAGAQVAVADIDRQKASDTTGEFRSKGVKAAPFVVDVTDERSVIDLFRSVESTLGSARILVNNAGIYPNKSFAEMSGEEWDAVLNVNLRGPFLCSREAVKQMREGAQGGRIVNISSINSLHPTLEGNAHYGASKGGLNMLTKNVALEFAKDRINVNALVPGGIATENRAKRAASAGAWIGPAADSKRFLLGVAPPWKHAAAVLFLVGPAGSHVTGQTFVTDGGFLIS